jgi:hypothetical protein
LSRKNTVEDFHARYIPEPNSGCWIWLGTLERNGYARFGGVRYRVLVHRFSYKLHHGKLPKHMCVLHRCDIRCCVNPDHLFLGTRKDNAIDCTSKGRNSRGERNGLSKLTEADVRQIRNDPRPAYVIWKEHSNIAYSTIKRIKSKKTWRHVF